MAFETGTELIVCPACRASHEAEWSRMPVRDTTTIRRKSCGAVALNAKTTRDYFDVRLTGPSSG